jgi:YegS/Rv2252/BmrU family lipid kinase
MNPIKVILNPIAGRGYGSRAERELCRLLAAEDVPFDLEHTQGTGHAAELAQSAANEGFEVIAAAGGDGTTHEVVNGLMAASRGHVTGTALGVIPVGSGSDFASNVGIPADLQGACRTLAHGQTRLVDVCRVKVDDLPARYFDNTVNVGFGGTVTVEARKVKWARGMALYLPVVLKTVFVTRAPQMTIGFDGRKVTGPTAMVCVANGAREGGGFFCTPDAQPDDGLLDVCIVREIGRLAMLRLVPHFMTGSHIDHDSVTMARTPGLTISSPDDLIAHADGEVLCTNAHRLEFDVLPRRLRVRC